MKKTLLIFFLTQLGALTAFGYDLPDSTEVVQHFDSAFYAPLEMRVEAPDELFEFEYEAGFNDSIIQKIDFARSIIEKVRSSGNFIRTIDANSKFELPVGISKTIGGLNYDVAIYAVRIKPTHAELDVVMEFEIPQNGKKLAFMGRGIKLSNQGGIVGDATLQLLGTYGINFNGDKIQLLINGGTEQVPGTYVTIDCDGFKEMALNANVIFSRDLLLPENLNGTVQPEGRVNTSFKTVIGNWNDLVVQLSLPNFQVKGLNGFGFTVDQAVFDFSDFRNAPAVVFPQGYTSNQMLPENQNLWRGFYVRQLSVRLPQQFKNKDNVRTSLNAYNMIIDNQGVSGLFEGKNLIPLNNGDMSGWAFSLDSIAVSLMANQIQEAGLKGKIIVPLADEQTPFLYTAAMQANDQYFFNVVSTKDMKFNLWQTSKVEIYQASRIEIRIADGKFLPKAVLHGNMSIQAKLSDKAPSGKGVELADISFENLEIQTVKPYIKVGNFSFGSEALQQKMAQFPISINNIGMRSLSDTETSLDFNLILNLTGNDAGANAFSADAGLSLVAEMYQKDGSQRWRAKRVDISSIKVDMTGAAYTLKGSLTFYRDDAVYGNGFNGAVEMALTKLNFKARASAIFGNVNGDRYWYADALAEFSPGILMFPGVNAKGFGGGAYFKMKMDKSSASPLGKTASGVHYVPDSKAGLGLKATIVLASAGTDKLFNADVTFEISFFQGGGIRYMSLLGNGNMLTTGMSAGITGKIATSSQKMAQKVQDIEIKVPKGSDKLIDLIKDDKTAIEGIHGKIEGKEGISFRAFIDYDFENRVLHGNFEAYVNVAGGIIQGVGAGGRAGWAVMHFAPGEWYVYVGTPDDRIGLKVGIGPVSAQSGSYFMVGTKIPGSPPPPAAVSRILGGKDLDYMKDLNAIGNGAGVAFGSAFSISTGDLTFLIFYAKFEAGLGFDIMIKDYGETYCSNTGKRLGINGWYANGQAYAYFEGAVGIRVKVFGRRRSIEILSIGAAAVLQAQLPNPIWVQGTVGGYFRILGGLVKGNCRFEVTLGRKCEMVKKEDSVADDLKVISQLTPGDQEKDISVFTRPQAVFNMPVNKVFEITDDNGVKRSFRMQLMSFKIMSEGRLLTASEEWNEERDVLALNPFDVLPPKKSVMATAEVQFEELRNGSWIKVIESGQVITEKMTVSFSTGEAPDHIPLSNVEYSYPVIGQLNFYKSESTEGVIKLKQGQPYLFEPSADWIQTGRFTDQSGTKTKFDFRYGSALVNFTIPGQSLKNGEVYAFELVNVPKSNAGTVDRNVSEVNNQVQTGGQTLDTEVKSKKAIGTIKDLEEKSVFTAHIRSSAFNTLSDKINALSFQPILNGLRVPWRVYFLKSDFSTMEGFDKVELLGTAFTQNKPLIRVEALLGDNDYYNKKIFPLVYEGYPIDNRITIANRHVKILGLPPVGGVNILQPVDGLELSQSSPVPPSLATQSFFAYDLPYYYYYDFLEIQSKVVNHYLAQGIVTPRTELVIWSGFPVMLKGNYKVRVNLMMPGKVQPVNSKEIVFFNPIGE
jgi:hypothetical protein